jgi:hypothetical protein
VKGAVLALPGGRFRVAARLTVPKAATGVVEYHLLGGEKRVWGFADGKLDADADPDAWWATRLYTLGVRIYVGTWAELGYDGPPFTPPRPPDHELELDLGQCRPAERPDVADFPLLGRFLPPRPA